MELKAFKPSAPLALYVQAYRFIESHDEIVNRVLPDTSMAMAFFLRGSVSYRHADVKTLLTGPIISGLRRSVRLINYATDSRSLIVLFHPTGAPAFLKTPLYELFEHSVALDTTFRRSEISEVEERLCMSADDKERITVVEKFLLSKLNRPDPDKVVHEAISRMRIANGVIRINVLADSLCISQDAFEKRFRRVTGATPKQFAAILRMKTITQHPNPASLLDLAIEHGYYDQSHFNKDFKRFTGLTPSEFYKTASSW